MSLGCGLHVRRGFEQGRAAEEQRLGEIGDDLPLLLRHRIVGAEVEERPVAHLVADTPGEHEAVASDRLAVLVGVGLGGLDVHGAAVCACPVAHTRRARRLASGISTRHQSPGPTIHFRDHQSHMWGHEVLRPQHLVVQRNEIGSITLGWSEKVPTWVNRAKAGQAESSPQIRSRPPEPSLREWRTRFLADVISTCGPGSGV